MDVPFILFTISNSNISKLPQLCRFQEDVLNLILLLLLLPRWNELRRQRLVNRRKFIQIQGVSAVKQRLPHVQVQLLGNLLTVSRQISL